jgi:hypothetical protein
MSILADQSLDYTLREDGYVIIPLLSETTTNTLLQFYFRQHPQQVTGMYATAHDENLELRKTVSEQIKLMALPYIQAAIPGVEVLGGSFIAKGNDPQATLPPHQDWNIVDEQQFRSFNLWIPLVDTNAENGGIMVLPKSHLFGMYYRGPHISSAYEMVGEELLQNMKLLEIPAGHALLYDHRLLHASGPNQSKSLRIVAVMGVIERGASMKIYYQQEDEIVEYNCSSDFFLEANPQQYPPALSIEKSFKWTLSKVEQNQLVQYFNAHQLQFQQIDSAPTRQKNLIRRVIQWLTG